MEESQGTGGRLQNLLKNARVGLFGTLFVIQKKIHANTSRSILGSVIRFAQVISFVLSPYAFKAWNPRTIGTVRFILGLPTVHGYWSMFTTDAYFALFYASMVWVAVFLGLTVWSANCFVANNFPALWPLKLLRAIGSLSGSILFIPLFTLLLSNYQCTMPNLNKYIAKSGLYVCYQGGHLAQSILGGILAVAFVALCIIFTLVFYDSSPLSTNIVAKAHGRADLIFLCLKIILVITVDTFPTELPTWLLIALLIACAFVWVASMLFYLPFYDARWNAWTTAQASMFLYACVVLAISESYPDNDSAITLYLGIALAGAIGAYMCHLRVAYIIRTPSVRLSSPYDIEIKSRLILHQAIWGHPTEKSGHTGARGTDGAGPLNEEGNAGAGHGGSLDEAEGTDDVEQRMMALRKLIPIAVLSEMQALYRTAVVRFRSSAILHVFFSRFYHLSGNRHMQMSHLLHAERRHPPLDIAFVVFQARKLAEDDSGGGSQLNAIARVAFEKHSSEARKLVQKASLRQLAFWTELLQPQPDLSRLHTLSTEMGSAIESAETSFSELFALNPSSVATLHLYAAFNEYTLANTDKAGVLSQEAERIEDQKARDHRVEGGSSSGTLTVMSESSLDIMADNTAVVTIGGTPRNLGIVLQANAATSKLFGYSRLQLERRFLFTLLPEPLAGLWEAMLRSYVDTGEGKIASTHVVFGLTRGLYITPMLMCMRETPADEGPPGFIVLMRELSRTQENYVLLTSDFAMTAVSSGALQDLAIDAASLGAHEVSIADFVLEWNAPGVQSELRSGRGTTLCIDSRNVHKSVVENAESSSSSRAGDEPMDQGDGERTFVRATMHAVSLMPPRDDRLGEQGLSGPGSGHRGILETQIRIHGGTGTAKVAPMSPNSGSMLGSSEPDVFYVLTYTRVPDSDAYTLAKASKRRRDSLAALAASVSASGEPRGVVSPRLVSPRAGSLRPQQTDVSIHEAEPEMPDNVSLPNAVPVLTTPEDDATGLNISPPVQLDLPLATIPPTSASSPARIVRSVAPRGETRVPLPQATRPITTSKSKVKVRNIRSRFEEDEDEDDEGASQAQKNTDRYRNQSADGRTIQGKSSVSSGGTYGRRVMNRLRRVLADANSNLPRGLMALRAAGIFVMILSIALAVSAAVVLDGQFADYRSNLVYTDTGAGRILSFFTAITHAQSLVFMARGWFPHDDATVLAQRASLRESTLAFIAAHRSMYQMIQDTDEVGTYTDAVKYPVTLTEYDTPEAQGTDIGSLRTVNLFQAGLAIASALNNVADAPLANLTDESYPPTLMILTNGLPGGIAHETLHGSSLETGYIMSVKAKDSVRAIGLYVYVGISAVLAAVGLAVFTPILLNIEASKDAIVKRFVFLPMLVKLALQKQSEKRVQNLRRNFSEDDDDDASTLSDEGEGEDGDGEGGEDGEVDWDNIMMQVKAREFKGAKLLEKSVAQKGAARVLADASRGVFRSPFSWHAKISSLLHSRSVTAYKKSSRSVLLLFAKFLGPLMALFFFFTVIYAVSETTLESTLRMSSAQVAAAYRTACTRESTMDLTRTISTHHDRPFFLVEHDASADTIDCVRYHQQLLLFGVQGEESRGDYALATDVMETGKQGLLDEATNQAIYSAQFSDACPFVVKASARYHGKLTYDQCEAFSNGIVKQGLQTVLGEWVRLSRSALDRRRRARIVDGTLSGWVIPVREYPYANDTCEGGCWTYPVSGGIEILQSPGPTLSVTGDVSATWNPAHYGFTAQAWSMQEDMSSAEMQWLRTVDKEILTPAFLYIQDLYNERGIYTVDNFRSFLSIFVGVFVAIFVLFMAIVFLPQVRALHNELQKKRSMLLFLPPQIIKSDMGIRQLVDEILADDNSGLGRMATSTLRSNTTLRDAGVDETISSRSASGMGVQQEAMVVGDDGSLLPRSASYHVRMDKQGFIRGSGGSMQYQSKEVEV